TGTTTTTTGSTSTSYHQRSAALFRNYGRALNRSLHSGIGYVSGHSSSSSSQEAATGSEQQPTTTTTTANTADEHPHQLNLLSVEINSDSVPSSGSHHCKSPL